MDAVRHLWCRRLSSPLLHGFALWASPAVKHGVSPAGDSGCGLGGFFFLSLSTSPLLHGFTLRASPAVMHGVSPLGTVSAGWEVSLFSPSPLSTGSPFGHHPRLRIVCPLWGQWVDNELFLLLPRKINYGEECVFS